MKKRFKLLWSYLIVLSIICITILIINNINGYEKVLPKIVMDINSGVIGAILTTIITLLLLSNQNELQESQLKNSVIYEEKLKLFNEFLTALNKALEDGNLSPAEMKNIIFHYSVVRMHISEKSATEIEGAVKEINESFFYVNENYVPHFEYYIKLYTKICNVLRKELYLNQDMENLPEFDFSNFTNIAFKRRATKAGNKKYSRCHTLYESINQIFVEDKKEGVKMQFRLDMGNLPNLEKAYKMISKILAEFSHLSIHERYLLNAYEINNEKYLGLLNVFYTQNDKQFATLGVSQKNRIFFKIKLPRESTYSFEIGSSVENYEENIRKDLKQYFNSPEFYPRSD